MLFSLPRQEQRPDPSHETSMTKYLFATLTRPGDSFPIPEGASKASVRSAARQYDNRHNIRLRVIGDRGVRDAPDADRSSAVWGNGVALRLYTEGRGNMKK